jgi:Leucine-rich repeat (LRR) protein
MSKATTFSFYFFLLMCLIVPPSVAAQVVDIPDLNLRAAFEDALGKASGAIITTADMANLTSLEAHQGVHDLTGLESATNLTTLRIYGNVSDLSPLAGLTQLNSLDLTTPNVSDLSPLAGLTQLNHLELNHTSASDLSPLAGLTQLNHLGLAGNRNVSDLSPLAGLTQLNYLYLSYTSVSDLSPLAGLTNLYYLHLNENNISDLSSLEGLDRLTYLYVKGNPLSYQSIHTHIPTLQRRGGRVEFDSRSVAELLNISGVISASNNTLTIEVRDSWGWAFAGVPVTFTVVSGGGTLSATNTIADEQGRAQSILTLGDGEQNSIEASVTGTTLAIILSDTVVPEVKIPDPNLRAAFEHALGKASGAIITTADMARLTHLHARNIDINDLTGLESATNLTYLSLNDNNISDISPLKANTGLGTADHVHLWGNPLSSLSLNDYIPALRGRGVRVVPDEEAEPYTVGLIYFLPNDSQPRPNVDAQIDAMIKEIQESVAYWMEAYGFDRKTFTFQADATGKAVVHHVNGRFNETYYTYDQDGQYDRYAKWKIWDEIDEQFGSQRTLYVCLIDGIVHSGLGSGGSLSGRAVTHSYRSANFPTDLVGHELAHAFGLFHYYGIHNWDSACRTEWLDVHRYLNPTQRSHDVSYPRIRMLPPSFVAPPNTIRLRFEVEDDDGLHQAQLLRYTPTGDIVAFACKRLTGTHSTVEFVTTELRPEDTRVGLLVIDAHGDFSRGGRSFSIDVASIIPPPQVVSIPDTHLAAKLRTELGLDPGDPITSHGMLSLWWELYLVSLKPSGSLDLTGIDSAINVRDLRLDVNSILDFSPLEGLTNLKSLNLSSTSVSDPSFLAGLTNLKSLHLSNNSISDLSPLAGLKNLSYLELRNNSISDLSPLVENTQLGLGTSILVNGNPLSYQSIHTHIPILQSRGISVEFDNQAHKALLKISGDDQKGKSGAALANPFVIEVQDENGSALEGISVTFSVTAGDGTVSVTSTTTDPNGRAETTLTLGPNLGTNTVQVSAAGIAVLATFHAFFDTEAPLIGADINKDGNVNVLDLVLIVSNLGQTGQNDADVNRDGVVSTLDLVLAAGMFDGVAAAPSAQPEVPETLTAVEVQGWLTDARALEVRDPIMKRGVVVLEQLLISLTPKETELLANYPNPFNPETWIPYRLAEDGFVTLTIYNPSGQVVRTLDVGHRIASAYESQSKAIYWDGKNDLGEPVASGVYFYTLSAGRSELSVPHRSDFSATRKMVILK